MNKTSRFSSFFALAFLPCGIVFLQGCGGGSSSSAPNVPTATPIPGVTPGALTLVGNYTSAFAPSGAIPSDARNPSQRFQIEGSRATSQFTYFLPQSVIDTVQEQIDDGLRSGGAASEISRNQLPKSIEFSTTDQADANGKVVLTSSKIVNVCGLATLRTDATFVASGLSARGAGNYEISFPDNLTLTVFGRQISTDGSCNNLPLRSGTVSLTR